MQPSNFYINIDSSLKVRAHHVWNTIYDAQKLYALTFDKLNKSFPIKYVYELHLMRPVSGEYSLRLIYYEMQVLKYLRLLTESESETLVDLIISKDISNQLVALAILKNKLKEKSTLEKKGDFAKEFAEISSKYNEIVIDPGKASFLNFRGKSIEA